jgi:hypothetical protein
MQRKGHRSKTPTQRSPSGSGDAGNTPKASKQETNANERRSEGMNADGSAFICVYAFLFATLADIRPAPRRSGQSLVGCQLAARSSLPSHWGSMVQAINLPERAGQSGVGRSAPYAVSTFNRFSRRWPRLAYSTQRSRRGAKFAKTIRIEAGPSATHRLRLATDQSLREAYTVLLRELCVPLRSLR